MRKAELFSITLYTLTPEPRPEPDALVGTVYASGTWEDANLIAGRALDTLHDATEAGTVFGYTVSLCAGNLVNRMSVFAEARAIAREVNARKGV